MHATRVPPQLQIVASLAPKDNSTTDHTDKTDETMIHEELSGKIIGAGSLPMLWVGATLLGGAIFDLHDFGGSSTFKRNPVTELGRQ
jgi:hypothetical protein